MTRRFSLVAALAFSLLAPLPAGEPLNVSLAKEAALQYYKSGEYDRDLAKVAAKAVRYVATRAARPLKPGEKRAIVFDIDETTLNNVPHIIAQDFGYLPAVWDRWASTAGAAAIAPVQEIYATAVKHDVAVIFITARPESQREMTERNLRQAGYTTWEKAFFKSGDSHGTSQDYKTGVRRQLTAEGWTIIANVGDQETDLLGGYAERTFKLPNPFYRVK